MTFAPNPGFLAVAFMEGSAAFILLVLYWLLVPSFPARFFRYWLAGWTVYVGLEGLRIYSLWRGGSNDPRFVPELAVLAAALFFAAVLECLGLGKSLKYLWPLGGIVASLFIALGSVSHMPHLRRDAESMFECLLYLTSGWLFWRSQGKHRGVGWKLLAGGFLLRGLHGMDRSDWTAHSLGLFRVSFEGLFGIMMGIAMAVLVLEAGRVRTEDLNEKLRRLALITAEATQSSRVEDALQGVLHHLVESLAASHGLVLLIDDPAQPTALGIGASVGLSDRFRKQTGRISAAEPWVQDVLHREAPFASYRDVTDATVQRWMETERLDSLVLVRIPGKTGPLGMLGIGSSVPRSFETEEEHYLVNVANLLGLTVENVALFESAAASRRQWLDTFDSIDDLILVHSLDGRIIRANRPLAQHLEVEPESLVGRGVRDVLRQGSVVPWVRCPYCEGAAGKAETIDPSFGGYFLATDSALHDSEGGRLGTIHVLKDFTSRRQAENKFRTLFEKVQEGVFISTPEGHFVDFNDAFMRILGYESHDDLLRADLPAQLYVDPADRERRQRLLQEYGEVVDFEFDFLRLDGEVRTAHESSFATRDDSGAVVAYQGFLLDITDQKQAEIDIRRRNRALLALNAIGELLGQSVAMEDGLTAALLKITELFSLSAAAVYFLDQPTRVLKRAAAVGYQSESARRNAPMQISAGLVEQIRQARATLLSGALPALPEEFRELHHKENIQISQIVVLWAKDRIMGILVVGNREMRPFSTAELNLLSAVGNQIAATIDKSLLLEKTREAYDTLRCTQEQLLQSEKMAAVGQLISGVAHELNNPLTAILGYSQLLKSEEFVHPRGADYLEKLYKQAQRTHHIVQNLLSFARQQKPHRAPVQLNQILEDTLVLREFDMKLHNIVVHREFEPHLPMTAGDFHQLEQVFLNLLNNAVDAIQEKGGSGEIWIRTETVGQRLCVEVTDSGPGVTNPHKIFDPFYTTKPVGKGTGLGLSICYGIVKEHGGEIQVRNSPPRGATFSISLPLSDETSVASNEPASRRAHAMPGTILLVDQEEALLLLEQEVLVSSGALVKVARTAEEAIEILNRDFVDAVVSDINLPGKTSTADLYGWIKENRLDLATRIVFTASNAGDAAAHILRNSGCPVLAKPFPVEEFCKAVQSVLAGPVTSNSRS
ncbi:MAG TPA: ATP-binding protein [Candidatus Acidoferrales bacterium]|nr:ATP-binding protein [Candidatus Acidoferrales bacterium]